MTTGSDGRHVQPHCARLRSKTYHPWKFGYSISCSFWEKGWTWKNGNRSYLATGSENRKIEKTEFASFHNTSTLKISRKSIQPSLRNRPDKKGGKIRIIGITKNKQSNNYKVFRLKRKTLNTSRNCIIAAVCTERVSKIDPLTFSWEELRLIMWIYLYNN